MWRLVKNKKGYVSFANAFIMLVSFLTLLAAGAICHFLSEPETNIVQGETIKQNDVYKKILQGPKFFPDGEVK